MRLHRFIGHFDLNQKQIVVNSEDFVNQARNVLRLKVGDKLILCDGNLKEAVAEIVNLNKEFAELKIVETCKNENESEKNVALYCSVLKKENFEITVQKAVEVGVKEIVPIITDRTVKLGLNKERLNKIIKEAAEQSGRGILPNLNEAIDFDKAIIEAKNKNEVNLFFQIGYPPLGHSMSKFKKIGVFVGPEGGWTEEETKIAQSNGFTLVGLGKTILRAETAAMISSYLTANLC